MNILCLAHDADDKPNGCPKRDQCQRHLTFRENEFPEADSIVGTGCSSNDYLLFMPKGAVNADA